MQSLPAAIWDSTGPHLDDLQAMRLQMDLSRILCKISVLAADHCSDGGLRLRKACSDANQSAYLTVSMMLQRHLDLHTLQDDGLGFRTSAAMEGPDFKKLAVLTEAGRRESLTLTACWQQATSWST